MKMSELNYEDFKKVVEGNEGLCYKLYEYTCEDANLWIEEVLHDIPSGVRYEISDYGYSYIKFGTCDKEEVAEYLNKINRMYCIFCDDDKEELAKVEEELNKFAKYWNLADEAECGYINMTNRDYDNVCEIAVSIMEKYEEALVKYLVSFYEADLDYQIEAAYNCEWFDNLDYDEESGLVTETTVKVIR